MWWRNNRGMALAEVMMAAGILGGISLAVMQMTKNTSNVQVTFETSAEITQLQTRISTILLNQESCVETLKGFSLAPGASANLATIKFKSAAIGATVEDTYKSNTVAIKQIASLGQMEVKNLGSNTWEITVPVNKLKKGVQGGFTKTLRFPVQVILEDDAKTLKKCFSDTTNAVNTAVMNACQGRSARLVFNASSKVYECYHEEQAVDCGPGKKLSKIAEATDGSGKAVYECTDVIQSPATCDAAAGKYLKSISADGKVECGDVSDKQCAKDEYSTGIDNLGKVQCKKIPQCTKGQYLFTSASSGTVNLVCKDFACPTGQVAVLTSSGFACQDFSCPKVGGKIQYLAGVNSAGVPQCKTLLDGAEKCGTGGIKLSTNSSGAIELACCQGCLQKYGNALLSLCSDEKEADNSECGDECWGLKSTTYGSGNTTVSYSPSLPSGASWDQTSICSRGKPTCAKSIKIWIITICVQYNMTQTYTRTTAYTKDRSKCDTKPNSSVDDTITCTYKTQSGTFTSGTGVFTMPANAIAGTLRVWAIGGGGGGGDGTYNYTCANAGGYGGSAAVENTYSFTSLAPGSSCSYTVGGGGSNGRGGRTGGTTEFKCGSDTLTATGGAGGGTSNGCSCRGTAGGTSTFHGSTFAGGEENSSCGGGIGDDGDAPGAGGAGGHSDHSGGDGARGEIYYEYIYY